jgi:hypothetical protein
MGVRRVGRSKSFAGAEAALGAALSMSDDGSITCRRRKIEASINHLI